MDRASGDDSSPCLMVLVASTVGMLVLVTWSMCGRCCKVARFIRVVEAGEMTLFAFLADPHNLKAVHPLTTDIRVEEETMEEETDIVQKKFVWIEKVSPIPNPVESNVRMRCNPKDTTVVMDIDPTGRLFTVQLEWRVLRSDDTECIAEHHCRRITRIHQLQPSKSTRTSRISPSDSGDPGVEDSENTDLAEFHNEIRITGPRLIIWMVMAIIVKNVQMKLMDKVQQHFRNIKLQQQ